MKIGVLSDTHNERANLAAASAIFQAEGIQILIHCGDLTSPETAADLINFRVIHVVGNGDHERSEIEYVLKLNNTSSSSGLFFTGQIGGVPMAAAHGHASSKLTELLHSGSYRYVFSGHTHVCQDKMVGSTRWINPGSLGGHGHQRSIFILDLDSGEGRFITL